MGMFDTFHFPLHGQMEHVQTKQLESVLETWAFGSRVDRRAGVRCLFEDFQLDDHFLDSGCERHAALLLRDGLYCDGALAFDEPGSRERAGALASLWSNPHWAARGQRRLLDAALMRDAQERQAAFRLRDVLNQWSAWKERQANPKASKASNVFGALRAEPVDFSRLSIDDAIRAAESASRSAARAADFWMDADPLMEEQAPSAYSTRERSPNFACAPLEIGDEEAFSPLSFGESSEPLAERLAREARVEALRSLASTHPGSLACPPVERLMLALAGSRVFAPDFIALAEAGAPVPRSVGSMGLIPFLILQGWDFARLDQLAAILPHGQVYWWWGSDAPVELARERVIGWLREFESREGVGHLPVSGDLDAAFARACLDPQDTVALWLLERGASPCSPLDQAHLPSWLPQGADAFDALAHHIGSEGAPFSNQLETRERACAIATRLLADPDSAWRPRLMDALRQSARGAAFLAPFDRVEIGQSLPPADPGAEPSRPKAL